MNFNEKLQSLRKSSGITQEKLAEKLGVTRQTVSKWECGESSPDFRYLVKISEIFNVSTDALLKDNEPTEESQKSQAAAAKTYIIKNKFDNKSLLGACLFGAGVISILVFFILSTICPMTVVNNYGTFDGLLGFLMWKKMVAVFIAVCLISLIGLILLLRPFFHK